MSEASSGGSSGQGHQPVLSQSVADLLPVQPDSVVLDATVGLGGHSLLFSKSLGEAGLLIGLDVDSANLSVARQRLSDAACRVSLHRSNFCDMDSVLSAEGVGGADVILADLGVSSTQLDEADRGFSFQSDGPLDMRMDSRLAKSAEDLVNELRERELADLFYEYGQERMSRRIAKHICRSRKTGRIKTTGTLSRVICESLGVNPNSRASRIHPATRVFQALRIVVNDELGVLGVLLEKGPGCLSEGGRIGVISFHSLEDRMVKLDFRERAKAGVYRLITKKPVVAGEAERRANRRSRSAKLRVAEKL
jgi:16S rRNA (cytosine1402-N4)-methyltransferase